MTIVSDRSPVEGPLVSILMVARNAQAHLDEALWSARRQSYANIEIVMLDDGSTDRTRAMAERHAAEDGRVRVLDGPKAGLAAIRTASLHSARGRWAAILDSDDIIHPRHIELLVEAATRSGAEIVAANMISFHSDDAGIHPSLFADRPGWDAERWIDLPDYVRANGLFVDAVSLGYLKPLFDMDFLRRHELSYDMRLRIGEDYDLVARTMACGARFRYIPMPTYFYRRHDASTSHRTSRRDIDGLIETSESILTAASPPDVVAAVRARSETLLAARAHHDAVEALKAKRPLALLRGLLSHPGATPLLARSLREGLGKRLARKKALSADRAADRASSDIVLLGTVEPGGAVDRLARRLEQQGHRVDRIAAGMGDVAVAGRVGHPSLILLANEQAAAVSPYLIAPLATLVGGQDLGDRAGVIVTDGETIPPAVAALLRGGA